MVWIWKNYPILSNGNQLISVKSFIKKIGVSKNFLIDSEEMIYLSAVSCGSSGKQGNLGHFFTCIVLDFKKHTYKF